MPPGAINGPSRIYGRIEASIDSLEPAEKDLLGCVGSRFFLKTAGRKRRADVLDIIASKVFAKKIWMGVHCLMRQGFYLNSIRQCEWLSHKHECYPSTELWWLARLPPQSLFCLTAPKMMKGRHFHVPEPPPCWGLRNSGDGCHETRD